jgi:hypothetical protein
LDFGSTCWVRPCFTTMIYTQTNLLIVLS